MELGYRLDKVNKKLQDMGFKKKALLNLPVFKDMTKQNVYFKLDGTSKIKLAEAKAIADFLNDTVDDLFF